MARSLAGGGGGGGGGGGEGVGSGDPDAIVPPPPRPVMPELYVDMPQDPMSRILDAEATARGRAGEGSDAEDAGGGKDALPPQGTGVDYCIFCYHGTTFLQCDNNALLTKFISERGSILPKRFTRCCAKHQRKCVGGGGEGRRVAASRERGCGEAEEETRRGAEHRAQPLRAAREGAAGITSGAHNHPPSLPTPTPHLRLDKTIKRARWLNLLTVHAKPHPRLRFTSLKPMPITGPAEEAGPKADGLRAASVL